MNNKGVTVITMVFVVGFFILVWTFLGGWINDTMAQEVERNELAGLEAWILLNFNFVIFLSLLMFMVVYVTFAGGGEG